MTLAVYAQCMKRQRIDQDLVWALMRFPDEDKGRIAKSTPVSDADQGAAATMRRGQSWRGSRGDRRQAGQDGRRRAFEGRSDCVADRKEHDE